MDEIILLWKKQDPATVTQVMAPPIRELVRQKSKHTLQKIRMHLAKELCGILIGAAIFDVLYFIVNLPPALSRWICFTVFNGIIVASVLGYLRVLFAIQLDFNKDLGSNIENIANSLIAFRHLCQLVNLPVLLISFIMFAGAQNILILVPWMIIEWLIIRWILLPKLRSRFDSYLSSLRFSLSQLKDV